MLDKFNTFLFSLWASQKFWLSMSAINLILLVIWVQTSNWVPGIIASASALLCALRADSLRKIQ